MPRQYALEGNPDTCYPSFPVYETYEEAYVQANTPHMTSNGHRPPRLLTRKDAGHPWMPLTNSRCACPLTDPVTWVSYGSAYEPGSEFEFNPDCPEHGDA